MGKLKVSEIKKFRRTRTTTKGILDDLKKFTTGVIERAVRIEATATFGAFVASIPCETGLSQHNATVRVNGLRGMITGIVLTDSRGNSSPSLGYVDFKKPPKTQVRISKGRLSKNEPAPHPDFATVKVVVHRGTGKMILDKGMNKITIECATRRSAYQEPLMAKYMPLIGEDDYDVIAYRFSYFQESYDYIFAAQHRARWREAYNRAIGSRLFANEVPF